MTLINDLLVIDQTRFGHSTLMLNSSEVYEKVAAEVSGKTVYDKWWKWWKSDKKCLPNLVQVSDMSQECRLFTD